MSTPDTTDTTDIRPFRTFTALSEEDYRKRVFVRYSEDPDTQGALMLRTEGLNVFGAPELEMRQVPAVFLEAALQGLNFWGRYSITTAAIKAGERLGNDLANGSFRAILLAQESPHPDGGLVLEPIGFVVVSCGCSSESAPSEPT